MKLATREIWRDGAIVESAKAFRADTTEQRRAIAAHRRARLRMLSNLAEFGVFGDATAEMEWAEREVVRVFGAYSFCPRTVHVDTRGNGARVVFRYLPQGVPA